jgi:peroxiredoxin
MTLGPKLRSFLTLSIFAALFCASMLSQTNAKKQPKTIFFDADGSLITNNEFVDLRMANPAGKDPATKTMLEDGTVEFRLARVPQEGTTAPAIEAPTIDGKLIKADYLKGKVVVLNFWFIGCPGCMDEIPKLSALAAKYRDRDDVEFIAIAPNSAEDLNRFLERVKFDYKMIGSARSVINLFAFTGFPRNIVVGRDGRIVYWRSTVRAWDKFESVIQTELNKN